MIESSVRCYCLRYSMSYDPEDVWAFVQRHNGFMDIRAGGEYWFYVYAEHESLFRIAYPELIRRPELDYIV